MALNTGSQRGKPGTCLDESHARAQCCYENPMLELEGEGAGNGEMEEWHEECNLRSQAWHGSSRSKTGHLPGGFNLSKGNEHVVLSTDSPIMTQRLGSQQLIPRGLVTSSRSRALNQKSDSLSSSGPSQNIQNDNEAIASTSPFRRGLRATSYRKAVAAEDIMAGNFRWDALDLVSEEEGNVPQEKESPNNNFRPTNRPLKRRNTFDKDPGLYQNFTEKALSPDQTIQEECEDLFVENQSKETPPDGKNGSASFPVSPASPNSDQSGVSHHDDAPPPACGNITLCHQPVRMNWSQLPEVQNSGILERITSDERKRQEVIFEIITSEHSYLHSLDILLHQFLESSELTEAMTKLEHHHLFSNIAEIRDVSERFFRELESRHQESVVIDDISDVVQSYARNRFDPYVKYCSNEMYQQRTLQKLWISSPVFKEVLRKIEMSSECGGLPMISFLILPMQRVTRLPLLMDTICQKSKPGSHQHENAKNALKAVSKLVKDCNDGAKRMERTEMMCTLQKQLVFKIKPFPLVSSARGLRKRGELCWLSEEAGIFRKTYTKVYLFLFNDVVIITKKKSDENYFVTDYALQQHITAVLPKCDNRSLAGTSAGIGGGSGQSGWSPLGGTLVRQLSGGFPFLLVLEKNHAGAHVDMILICESVNERARWVSAITNKTVQEMNLDQKAKHMGACKQVEAIRPYSAKQPDELSLTTAEVVMLWQTTTDGWYEGERLQNGERGWFPADSCKQITCELTIQHNIQRLERFMGIETVV
uniref:Rho guanine nucleotide exchange factor 26 n=1 Tax=Eptatretus burgeri TaxID=7764 RepID=A0A8C4QM09_EPTBU